MNDEPAKPLPAKPLDDIEHGWDVGWEGHEIAQLKRMAKLPFAEKVQWLEEAHQLVLHFEKQRAAKGLGTIR